MSRDAANHPVRWIFEHATPITASLGLIVYGIVRVGLDAFYSRLEVTAEQVGLSYGPILSRAALGFMGLLVLSSVAASFFALLVESVIQDDLGKEVATTSNSSVPTTRLEAGQIPPPWMAGYAIGILVLLLFLAVYTALSRIPAGIVARFLPSFTILVISFGGPAIIFFFSRKYAAHALSPPRRRDPYIAPIVLVASILAVVILALSSWAGEKAAKRVETGQPRSIVDSSASHGRGS
jgi:hypothetical protein